MDLTSVLKVNQLVHIEVLNNKGEVERYASRVENLTTERVTLASPLKNRVPVFVPSGNYVTVFFSDALCVYNFSSRVLGNINQKVPLLLLEAPDTLEKVQKREYVRVPINLNVLLSYSDEEGQVLECWCKSRDLSGGGLMLVSNKALPVKQNAKVKVAFQLDDDNIYLDGEIMRVYQELDVSGIVRHILGVKFVELNENSRQKIIKFVFQKQIEMRRKGLL